MHDGGLSTPQRQLRQGVSNDPREFRLGQFVGSYCKPNSFYWINLAQNGLEGVIGRQLNQAHGLFMGT